MSQTLCCSPCQVGDQLVTHCDHLCLLLPASHAPDDESPCAPLLSSLALSCPCWWPQCSFLCIWLFSSLLSYVAPHCTLRVAMFAACAPLWVLGVGSIRGFGCCGVACRAGRGTLHQVPWGFCCILGHGPTWAGGCYGRWELGSYGHKVQRGAQLARWLRAGIAAACPLLGGAVPACHWGCWAGH